MAHSIAPVAIVAFVGVAAIEPASAWDNNVQFAAALQRVIRASRENFRPVEGARIELHPGNKSYFQARVDLPGTTECRIDEPPNLIYSCKWKPPQLQPQEPLLAISCWPTFKPHLERNRRARIRQSLRWGLHSGTAGAIV